MGNNTSNSVLHNIDSMVTRLAGRSGSTPAASPTGPASPDDSESAAARRLVCEVLRASVKEVLRQQLRAAAAASSARSARPRGGGDQVDSLHTEAERLVAGVLEAAIDLLAEELVPDVHSMNGPTKCKSSAIGGPQLPQQQQPPPLPPPRLSNQPDTNDQHLVFLTEIASRMVNSKLNESQLSTAVEQLTRHRSEFRLSEAKPKSDRTVTVDLALLGPYLRCLSHAGVLNDASGPAITLLVFDAARLPDCDSVRGYDSLMLQLFTLLCHAIRQLRTPAYSLVYLHSPATRGQFPKVAWLKQAATWLESQSGLSRVYVLHSTFSLSTLSVLSRAFTSRSFRDRVTCVSSLQQLQDLLPQLASTIPDQLDVLRGWEAAHKGFGF